ncbi:MAG: 16S rRNA (adenine(1518)-N(6)/adenine(1519)-N(6))-dimethyltransferase RsmA [Bacillota bacterium]|nr:16S rRNA (adenine(1518)-N(6)/adenine(1519)-N(6))-dimethyltransferase RsmA [Bacillota bacterium]
MNNLYSPTYVKKIFKKYNFRYKKKLGQNFLIDKNINEKIIEAASITKEDVVIEIGPGLGNLTQILCENAKEVISIEIDEEFRKIHEDILHYDNLEIIYDDFMKIDLNKILEPYSKKEIKVVANLPYYITTPIIMKLLEEKYPVNKIVVMIQKEVAERFASPPGNKDYGAITLAINYYTETHYAFTVPPSVFVPRPKVSSAVVVFDVLDKPKYRVYSEEVLFNVIKGAFAKRRKTFVNSLSTTFPEYDKDSIVKTLEHFNLNKSIRGEKLSLEEFVKISNYLMEMIH